MTDSLVQVEVLTKRYGEVAAVDAITFDVRAGEIFGFLGPNGAGKTTTIKMLTGLVRPTSGSARICGHDIVESPLDAKRVIGYVPDEPNLYGKLTAYEFLRFVADVYGVDPALSGSRIDELLDLFELGDAGTGLIEGYSHGMKQKVALCAALLHEPRVYFLDEPTVGLDPKSARILKDIVRQMTRAGNAVFMSTHIMEIAQSLCDRVAIIDRGRIAAVGTPADLSALQGLATLEDTFLHLTGGVEDRRVAEIFQGTGVTALAVVSRGPFAEGWVLTKALVRHRALAIRRDWKSRSLYGFALSLALGVFCLIFAGTYGSVRVLQAASANGMIDSVPAWAFLIYLFTDILIAFGQALGDLYLSRDMPILVSMPLRTASIIIAKFALGVAQNEVYALIFLLPFTLAYLAGLGAAWWTYPVAAAAVFIFPATLYAPLIVVTIAALRAIPAKIAKEGLWIIGASVPTIFWFLSFYRVAHLSGNVATMRLPTPPDWLPSTWIGDAIAMLAQGNTEAALTWLSLLAMATFVACPAALIIVSRSFGQGWSAAISLPARRRVETGAPRKPSSPVAAMIRKDALMFLRSPQLWFNHLTALAFVVFLLVGHNVQTPLLPLTPQLAMVQIGFVAVFGALNPGMTALSLEHLGVWVLRSAPLSARQILKAKFAVASGQTSVIAAVSAAALAFGYGFSAFVSTAMIAFAIGTSASSICVGIAFDAAFPNFNWENPNHINRGLRMVIPFLSNLGTLLVSAILLFGAKLAIKSAPLALGVGLAACVAVQIGVAIGTLRRARRDIAALEV